MKRLSFSVATKIWCFLCAIIAVSFGKEAVLSYILTLIAFINLAVQCKWKIVLNYGIFYIIIGMLIYGIKYHGLHMLVFSEFHVITFWALSPIVLMSWDLITTPPGKISAFLSRIHTPTPIILGVLVVFRFFPTMKSELRSVILSMKNRNLTGVTQILKKPVRSLEYVLVPLMIRILMIADQLSVSAIARGAESQGIRSSYYEKPTGIVDVFVMIFWIVLTSFYLSIGGVKI